MLDFIRGYLAELSRWIESLWARSWDGWQGGFDSFYGFVLGILESSFNWLAGLANTVLDTLGLSWEGFIALLVLLAIVLTRGMASTFSAGITRLGGWQKRLLQGFLTTLALGGVGTVAVGLAASYIGVGLIWEGAVALLEYGVLPSSSNVDIEESFTNIFQAAAPAGYQTAELERAGASVAQWVGYLIYVFAIKEVLQISVSSWVARFIVSRLFLGVSLGRLGQSRPGRRI